MNAAFRACLEDGSPDLLRKLWQHYYPKLAQPRTSGQAEVVFHRARTEAKSVSLARRCYSHAWLIERGLPSGLPHDLRPPGERDRPTIVSGVGIAVMARHPKRREMARALEKAMSDAVAECYADGVTDPIVVSRRIWQARQEFLKKA